MLRIHHQLHIQRVGAVKGVHHAVDDQLLRQVCRLLGPLEDYLVVYLWQQTLDMSTATSEYQPVRPEYMTHACYITTHYMAHLQQQLPAEIAQLLAPPNRQHRRRRHVCRAALNRRQHRSFLSTRSTECNACNASVIGCQ